MRRPLPARWYLGPCVAAVFAAVLLLPSAAGAANLAPNAGFEANCGGPPCQWTAVGFQGSQTTALDDTQNPHSGNASVKLTATGRFGSIESDCIPFTPGPVSFSFWYRTSDPNVTNLQYIPNFASDVNCSGVFGASDSVFVVPVRDGAWHLSPTQTMTVPSGPKAIVLVLTVSCDPCVQGPASAEANFDDVVFSTGGTTAVALRAFSATVGPRGVVVSWRMGSETGILGFNVYRDGLRLNRGLIPATGPAAGSAYRFTDRRAQRQRALRYRLQVVTTDGTARWLGAVVSA